MLETKLGPVRLLSTGTTIAAAIFDGGVVLGADTRATAGPVVAVKEEMKIHYITDNIWCCGAGTAADNDQITKLVSGKLKLFSMNTGMQPRVDQCNTILSSRLFKYGGYIQAALIVAGCDFQGPQIYTIQPHGSNHKSQFTSQGSGSLAALSVLETRWKPHMKENECMEMVADAIQAGITMDLGSGSNVNLCVVKYENPEDMRSKVEHKFYHNYRETNKKNFSLTRPIVIGEADVIRTSERPLHLPDVNIEILVGEST
jgi:20S proteasome subunit beta 2